jgi:hypothetical protein
LEIEGLTPEIYLRYKRKELTDEQIAKLYDVKPKSIRWWKYQRGLNDVIISRWETWEKYFPEDLKKLLDKFLELEKMYYSDQAMADEMGLTHGSFSRFKKRYFPDRVLTSKSDPIRFTSVQKRIITQRGLDAHLIRRRIREGGKTFEEAIAMGPRITGWKGDPGDQMVGPVRKKDLPEDYEPKGSNYRKKKKKRGRPKKCI